MIQFAALFWGLPSSSTSSVAETIWIKVVIKAPRVSGDILQTTVGLDVGIVLGVPVGSIEGAAVGVPVVGETDGTLVGTIEGLLVG
jgi:hypothetical protein